MGLSWNKALKLMRAYVYRVESEQHMGWMLQDLLGVDFKLEPYNEEASELLWREAEERFKGDERFERRLRGKSRAHWYIFPRARGVEYNEGGLEFIVEGYAVGWVEITYVDKFDEKSLTYVIPKPLRFAEEREHVPLSLLKLLSKGVLEGGGYRLVKLGGDECRWKIGGGEKVLTRKFVEWLMGLGEKPIEKLRELKLLDDLTFKVVQSAWESLEAGAAEGLENEKLEILREHEGETHRLAEWAEILGFKEKSGASKFFKRLEAEGLVKVEKTEEGLKVETAG
jgi:hypothetical protein